MASYRLTTSFKSDPSQVDIGGALPGDTLGYPAATRRVVHSSPVLLVTGMTTNISPSTTNDFRFNYLRNFWQWGTDGGAAAIAGLGRRGRDRRRIAPAR